MAVRAERQAVHGVGVAGELAFGLPVRASHNRMMLSSPPAAISAPSGLTAKVSKGGRGR